MDSIVHDMICCEFVAYLMEICDACLDFIVFVVVVWGVGVGWGLGMGWGQGVGWGGGVGGLFKWYH